MEYNCGRRPLEMELRLAQVSKFGSWLILLNYMRDSKLDNICILIYWLKMIEMA